MGLQQAVDSAIGATTQNLKITKGIKELETQNMLQGSAIDAQMAEKAANDQKTIATKSAEEAGRYEQMYNEEKQSRIDKVGEINKGLGKLQSDVAHTRGRRSNAWHDAMNTGMQALDEYSKPSQYETELENQVGFMQADADVQYKEYQRLASISMEKANIASQIAQQVAQSKVQIYQKRMQKKVNTHGQK